MKKIVNYCICAFVLVAVSACGNAASEENAEAAEDMLPKVTVRTVSSREVPQTEVYTSTVEANVVNNIAPQNSLRIKSIKAEIGDFVSKGQILAEMDVASLEQLKLQMINDSTELQRVKSLYEVGGVSKSDLDAISMSFSVRKTAYRNLLENTVLCSPINGVVTARNYDKGDMYSMSQPIYTIQEITPVKMLVAVSEKDYTKVKKGDKVSITADAFPGKSFTGSIRRLYPVMDAATHTFMVEVVVPNGDRMLRPGMFTRVTVNFGSNCSVVAPDLAVIKQQGSGDKYVFVLNEDGSVSYRKVVLGVRMNNEYEVLEGLKDGDKVVVEGQIRIKDGVKVEYTEE